jgi:peptidoglycan DL-endopeptidase CwlO
MLPGTAQAAVSGDRGASVLAVAETRAGDWYSYGAAGPSAFDCSGLVYWAAHRLGIGMPRTTYEMLGSGVLVRTYRPAAGDLAFYGSGHVEIVARGHNVTFGALEPGTRVGMHPWNSWWHPTMYFRVY